MISYGSDDLAIDGYSTEEVWYNLELMVEAGLLAVQGSGFGGSGDLLFQRLTWSGHEYLDAVRDPEVWRRTKEGVSKVGGASLSFACEMAKAYGKHVAKERLGLDL
jgi:hypothetical protein